MHKPILPTLYLIAMSIALLMILQACEDKAMGVEEPTHQEALQKCLDYDEQMNEDTVRFQLAKYRACAYE